MSRYRVIRHNNIVELWVSKNMDPAELEQLIRTYSSKGLYVVTYRSGNMDLAETTAHLLCHNR